MYAECYERGETVEERFMSALEKHIKSLGITEFEIYRAPLQDNMYKHIDVYLKINDKTFSFDVKALKKINRYDNKYSYDYTWFEFKNVWGNKGWGYGEQTHFAFQTENGFSLVKRKSLAKLAEENCNSIQPVLMPKNTKDRKPYVRYTRNDYECKTGVKAKDSVCLIPFEDIRNIEEKFIQYET